MAAHAAGDVLSGLTLTQLLCSRCHVVASGRTGRQRGPPLPQIVNHLRLDPDALRAWLDEAHSVTPNFSRALRPQQSEDIAAHLDSLRIH